MRRLVRTTAWAAPVLAVVCALLTPRTAVAQNVTEPTLKGALIHNFAKYTEWLPEALPPQTSFVACVLGDRNVAEALQRSVNGRKLSNHPVTVVFVAPDTALRSCHLLYISAVTPAQANAALSAVRGAPVLTMVDVDGFSHRGTIVRVFVDRGTVKFDIDIWLAKRSHLGLSSQVLSLASKTYSEPDALGGTQ
jgi:hypothetical protein